MRRAWVVSGLAFIAMSSVAAQVAPTASAVGPETPVARLELPQWRQRHAQKLVEAKAGRVDLVFLGDSITERYESGPYRPIWEYYTNGRYALDLGFSGDTTGNLLWRMTEGGELDGLHPKVAVLLIGTNNTSEKHPDWTAEMDERAMEQIVAEARTRMPTTRLLVLSILPAGKGQYKEDLDDRINAWLAARYGGGKVPGVEYVDVTGVFRHDGVLRMCLYADPRSRPPEGAVHPTPLGQAKLAAVLEPVLAKAMGDKARPPMEMNDPLCPAADVQALNGTMK